MSEFRTIPGFEELSEQSVLDIAALHVIGNGRKCMDERGICTYAGAGCAAAPFLRPVQRKVTVGGWSHLLALGVVPHTHSHLVAAIQSAHDLVPPYEDFLPRFKSAMRRLYLLHDCNPAVLGEEPPEYITVRD